MSNELFKPNQTFGDLLRYFRRRERLTQLELSIMVGYSEAQIGRLEKNQRRPDITALKALFIPALHLDNEPDLAEYFLELARTARQEDVPTPGISPYKGLLFFDESDCEMFFGREALTAQLVAHVMDLAMDASTRFLAVVGASGSGKSSLVRAGLAATLKRAGWNTYVFTPTANPLSMLEANLHSVFTANGERVLILVDQFEEVFTLCRDEVERIAFIDKLLSHAQDKSKKITVVITLRADFYAHCAQYPRLRQAVATEQEYIGQMSRQELRRAIEEPAKRGGWEFEPGLVDVLLNDVGAQGTSEPEPGALPLLSHALLATWERRRGRMFTLDGYHATGGVRGAIAETAESIFNDQLNQTQQELARNVFLRLTELGEGTEDTRRRAALNELVRQSAEAVQLRTVLNTLAEARLITLNEDSAEVAHEALIREWQRLREWLNEDRDGLKLHRHLTETVHEWELRGRDVSELYRGARLAQVREWAMANEERLNEPERAFLKGSIEQEERDALEREAQRLRELENAQKLAQAEKVRAEENIQAANRLRMRNRVITIVGGLALALAALASLFSLQANENAETAQRNLVSAQTAQAAAEVNYANAESLRLAAQANNILLQNGDPETAALLSVRALQNGYSTEADASLMKSLSGLYNRKLFQGHTDSVYAVAFSSDGKYALTGSADGSARLWNIQTGQEIRQFIGHTGSAMAVAFSPDGQFVLTGGDDHTTRLWNIESGQQVRIFSGSTWGIPSVTFSPDGKYILTKSGDTNATLWNAMTGKAINDFVRGESIYLTLDERNENVDDVALSPDGQYLITGTYGSGLHLWEAKTGRELRTFTFAATEYNVVNSVAFSPDGKYILASNDDWAARLWEVETGQIIRTFRGHTNAVNDAAFSPDGRYVLTGSRDKTAIFWDAQNGQIVRRYFGHEAAVHSVAFSPDGQYILTGSEDMTARLWAAPQTSPLFTFIGHTKGLTSVAYSPNGKYVLTGGKDNTARLWDVQTDRELRAFIGHTKAITSIAFSPDGRYVLTGSDDQTARLWDTETSKELHIFTGHVSGVASVAFSPNGKYILTTGLGKVTDHRGQTVLWDVETGKKIDTLEEGSGRSKRSGSQLAFSPDGTKLLIRGFDGDVLMFDIATGQELGRFAHSAPVNSVAFSPDGKYVLTSSHDKTARLWDAASGTELRIFTDKISAVLGAVFSLDGRYILTGHDNGTAQLWDLETGQALRTFTGHTDKVTNVAFSPDGKYVLTGSEDGTARLWHTDYHDTIRFACSLLWRDFTEAERIQYGIPDASPTCQEP